MARANDGMESMESLSAVVTALRADDEAEVRTLAAEASFTPAARSVGFRGGPSA